MEVPDVIGFVDRLLSRPDWSRPPSSPLVWAAALWAAAIALRLWILVQPDVVYAWDMALFVSWARGLNELGMQGFYDSGVFCDYPPVLVLLVRGVGWFVGLIVAEPSDYAYQVALKSLAVAGDFAIGGLLWREGTRLFGESKGLLVCGLYLLNPVAVYDSAVWGQFDSIYTMFLVAAFVLVSRGRWVLVGAAAAFALSAKFQAVAVLPLALLEAFRIGAVRGVAKFASGAAVAIILVAAPFIATDTVSQIWNRAYVDVVGQYDSLTHNAFNVWSFAGDPSRTDTTPPVEIVRAVAGDRESVAFDESPLLGLTLRRLSMLLFAVAVAVVLSLYSRRPGTLNRWGAAGLLVLSFYLFPTEMHERYAYPALALLAPWAASSRGRERLYWALTIAVTLNLVAVLPVDALARQVGAVSISVFVLLLWGLASGVEPPGVAPSAVARDYEPEPGPLSRPQSVLIRAFRRATVFAVLLVLLSGFGIYVWSKGATASASAGVRLGDLEPVRQEQGWGSLSEDRSVSGAPLALGDRYYVRGLGTHAPARLEYSVPEGAVSFSAGLGVNSFAGESGSVRVRFFVDGNLACESAILKPGRQAFPVQFDAVGAKRLRIEVEDGGDGNRSDHVDLVEARFDFASDRSSVRIH